MCDNLIRGGVNNETITVSASDLFDSHTRCFHLLHPISQSKSNHTLQLLSTVQPDDASQAPVSQSEASGRRQSSFASSRSSSSLHAVSDRFGGVSGFRRPYHDGHAHWNNDEAISHDEDLDTGHSTHDPGEIGTDRQYPQRRIAPRTANRTILLSNLAERTTHADITNVIRGGQLVEIFIRYKDRSATVSFVHEEECKAFFEHVRRHDLYINQKRVSN